MSGIVTDALTGAAISGAVVRVAGTTTGSAEVTAIADSRGRFVVVGLPAGDYGVRASLMGFFESRYGLDRPAWPLLEAPLPTVSLGPEQWRQDLGIRLWRLASLSGRVTDTRGRGEQLRLDLKARSFSSRFAKLAPGVQDVRNRDTPQPTSPSTHTGGEKSDDHCDTHHQGP
ncbi:MAG: carboxypeptidase regulatory-like domain-containing protein [Pirellulales bacterium]|nr:carboxypeptidase regulatory-like domain-containing protein [Pirellulales bacterium]